MLQVVDLCKQYKTGTLVQQALDHVSLSLRDNEFVAILGPSGSGKTTLFNVIGGLDRYDSGDLNINGVSTKTYRDRDWDLYRNHTIGFVALSLVVSSIMIGLLLGVMGIGLTIALNPLVSHILLIRTQVPDIEASLPVGFAGELLLLSIGLTLLGGFLPARKAAGSDPVAALRTE